MSEKLRVIDQREVMGREFRIYGTVEEPLFLAKDVAIWIDYSESNVSKLVGIVDKNEKVRNTITTPGGPQEMWFLTEDGLYEVLMQSRKPIAKQFKRKVKEILKDIRRHGMYATRDTLDTMLSDPDTMITLLTRYKEEKLQRERLEYQVKAQEPKVLFADAVETSSTSILVGDLAKLIRQNGADIGQNRLFQWMRDNGYLIQRKGDSYNMPTQMAMDLKLFEVKERTVPNPDGSMRITRTTKVTGKGQQYFINKFYGIG